MEKENRNYFAFHLDLNTEIIIAKKGFGHCLQSLVDVSYLKRVMLSFVNGKAAMQQLNDCSIRVSQKRNKHAISESKIFSTELKDCDRLFYAMV